MNGAQLPASANRWVRSKFELAAAAILAVMAAALVVTIARKSITADEIVLIPAAYYHWVSDDVHLIGQHPPLCKLLAGFPLLFIQPNEWKPAAVDPAGSPDENEWNYVQHFWSDNRAAFETISFWSRLPMIALTLAVGALLFLFVRDLFGPRVATLAVALFALEPTVLAHGRIVQTDIPAAFGLLATLFATWKYLRSPTWKKACFLGVAAASAILAKYSMLIVVPGLLAVFAALMCLRGARRRSLMRDALLATVIALVVINAAYFFHHRAVTPGDLRWVADAFPDSKDFLVRTLQVLRWVLPSDLIMGVYWQFHHAKVGHPAGLLGMHSNYGWWYYFPVAFFFKSTIPFLVLCLVSIVWATLRVRRESRWLMLLVPLAVYSGLMLTSPINIGIRYYLPGHVLLTALAAALLDFLFSYQGPPLRRHAARAAALLALFWMSVETVRTFPHYIPYMNQFAFARPHWWYLSDSNVEWGDDSKDLATWLKARGENRVRGLLLGCFATLDFYQVNYVDALGKSSDPAPRYTALGASFLNGSTAPPYDIAGRRATDEERVNTFDSYRGRTPEVVINGSIYVYRERD